VRGGGRTILTLVLGNCSPSHLKPRGRTHYLVASAFQKPHKGADDIISHQSDWRAEAIGPDGNQPRTNMNSIKSEPNRCRRLFPRNNRLPDSRQGPASGDSDRHSTRRTRQAILRAVALTLVVTGLGSPAAAAPVFGPQYALPVFPAERVFQKDAETGADLLFLTNAKSKDTHLYFHQRSWLADSRMILFVSARERGGLMGYIVETGELAQITAADGAKVGSSTAAVNRNSVLCTTGERVLEIQISITVRESDRGKRAEVTACERPLCAVRNMDGALNESCDGRYIAVGQRPTDGSSKAGIVVIDAQTGQAVRLCDVPDGVSYHGHVQWSMTNPHWLSFAGEPHRLWVVDIRDRKPWCPYRQIPDELVTHESWWVSDLLLFCGGTHPKPTEDSHLKTLDLRSGVVRIVGARSWWPDGTPRDIARRNWWHASGSPDGCWIAGDNWHGDIMLFEGKTTRPRLLTTNHRTYGGGEHPEVGWDRKGEQVVFGSHKLGGVTVCVATIPAAWRAEVTNLRVGLEAK
jgi:hypothetical protein